MAKAQTQPSFTSVLDLPSSEIERPKPLPRGSYLCIVVDQPRYDKSSKKQTPFIEFTLKLIKALDDVDEDDLKAIGGVKDKTIRHTFYYKEEDKDSLWRVEEFLDQLGVDNEDDPSVRHRAADATGRQILVNITHEPTQDGTSVFAKVKSTAAVE